MSCNMQLHYGRLVKSCLSKSLQNQSRSQAFWCQGTSGVGVTIISRQLAGCVCKVQHTRNLLELRHDALSGIPAAWGVMSTVAAQFE